MRSLWESIKRDSEHADRIPEFPPKKWFGNKTKEFLEQRRLALEIFFNTLLESPDKIIFSHIMKEAKDAIQSIEESISGNSRVQESRKEEEVKVKTPQKAQQTAPVENKNEDQKSESKQPVKIQQAKEVKSGVNLAKDSVENCNAIVKNFNKKLIDLCNNTGADAIQGIMNKGQNYVNHFKESEINKKFEFKTKMLGIPSGNDENIRIIEGQQDDIEEADDEVNDNLEKALLEITNILYKKQYEKFCSFGSCLITYQ